MKDKPLVSIITPALNSENFIENNLKSVHFQQKGDFSVEQIIIDGGSTDQTIDIIKSFRGRYNANITIIQGQDKNMYDAINKGLKIMKGDVWACLNTDDQYKPDIISLVAEEFNKHPEIDVVYGHVQCIDEKGKFIYEQYIPKFNFNNYIIMQKSPILPQPTVFSRKNVIHKIGYFNIKYNYAADYDYLIRVAKECKLMQIPIVFTNFRVHPAAISQTKKAIQNRESNEISRKYINKFGIKGSKFLITVKFYLIQIKFKNIKFLLKKLS